VTGLACVSVSGAKVALPVLERLSFGRDELRDTLTDLRRTSRANQLYLLSTCERTELYAAWRDDPDPSALTGALLHDRDVPASLVEHEIDVHTGRQAVHHLLRVTAGLESFVLGESDIVGQVRAAADAAQACGTLGLELERLLAAAVNTSRRVHRSTRFGEDSRSMAAAAVRLAASTLGGLAGRRILVVGAGHVAAVAVDHATRLGAAVTVCNRTRRHADRFAAAGAEVIGLDRLLEGLAGADVAIFGTASPRPLVDAARLRGLRDGEAELLLVDLCVPRNVDPDVGTVEGIRVVDLVGLRVPDGPEPPDLAADVSCAERIVAEEVTRYLRWLTGRSAVGSLRRLRADVEALADRHARDAARGAPEDLRPLLEQRVRRAVLQLAHGPTQRLLRAAEDGDSDLVETLAGLFAEPADLGGS